MTLIPTFSTTVKKKTIIIRHKKENLKKCSLRGLEKDEEVVFFSYPECLKKGFEAPSNCVLLALGGEELTVRDKEKTILLIDATWRLADKMLRCTPLITSLEKKAIPDGFFTAYPRRQEDCQDPERGLASIEALFIAYVVIGRDIRGLLDGYYWKKEFLEKNESRFLEYVTKEQYAAFFSV